MKAGFKKFNLIRNFKEKVIDIFSTFSDQNDFENDLDALINSSDAATAREAEILRDSILKFETEFNKPEKSRKVKNNESIDESLDNIISKYPKISPTYQISRKPKNEPNKDSKIIKKDIDDKEQIL